jgi:hypothetical protein
MWKSHVGVQTDLTKKGKEKEILEKGPDVSVTIYRGEINLYVSSRITRCIMSTSCVVVKFSRKSLANFCAALLVHAERLQDLFRPSWPFRRAIQALSVVYAHRHDLIDKHRKFLDMISWAPLDRAPDLAKAVPCSISTGVLNDQGMMP